MVLPRTPFPFTRTSVVSGKTRLKWISVHPSDLRAYEGGKSVQNAFPYLSLDEREFLISGITQEEWDETFKDSEERHGN